MPTQCQSGLFDRHARVVFLRVHVPSGDRHITVPCEISERPWVHERRPTRQARVPEGVEREGVEREGVEPVSYTHLDVYKRQVYRTRDIEKEGDRHEGFPYCTTGSVSVALHLDLHLP